MLYFINDLPNLAAWIFQYLEDLRELAEENMLLKKCMLTHKWTMKP
jgi:hypothetical protein